MSRGVAIVLAAGESRRMGVPKPLLEVRGQSFLGRLASEFQAAGWEVCAVVGCQAARVRAAHPDIQCVENAAWSQGQFSSVCVGLRWALDAGATRVLVHPVDVPNVLGTTATAVGQAVTGAVDAAVPVHDGVRGHPLVLSASAAARVLAMGAAHLEAALGALRVVEVAVTDPGVGQEADTPEDYWRLFGAAPRPLSPGANLK